MKHSHFNFSRWFTCLALLMLGGFVTACSSSGDNGAAAPGAVSVSLTDAPACGYDAVYVTVSKVRVHQSSSADDKAAGWTDITLDPPRKINLLDFNDPTQPVHVESLGITAIEAGHYTQLRLVLVANSNPNRPVNSVVLSGDPNKTEIPLDTPSGIQSGIKLIHEFTVPSGQRMDLLLDFDACKSIVQTGNGTYKLKPVIRVIPFALNGIDGFLSIGLFPQQTNVNHIVVSAQVNGDVVRSTMPNAVTGEFFLAHLDPGTYDVVFTAINNPANTCCATVVIAGVPVPNSTSITKISTNLQPLQLQASGFHTIGDMISLINPPPPPAVDDRDDATVVATARQSLSSGPTVAINAQVATLKDDTATVGDYAYGLVLPTAAPFLASYGPLPIVPSAGAQSSVAGVYTVRGSAQTPTLTYQIQNPPPTVVNIFAGDRLDEDFTLAP
ncbi:MAG TPA: DUF4382 domain-containing protein [Nitrospira sp.]|nr:DUF4382 domain-containing protein [Nitrospira sp.]